MHGSIHRHYCRYAFAAGLALVLAFAASSVSAEDLSGEWSGRWLSCTSGHKGPLKATFCRVGETRYDVTFSGRFFMVLPFRYNVTLDVVSDEGDTVMLAGSSYLGRLFGTFTYQATASETKFTANYTSCKDNGKFVLCRTCTFCGCK